MRLEHENKMLRLGASGGGEDGAMVSQDMLDEANARRNELETEVRYISHSDLNLFSCLIIEVPSGIASSKFI